MVRLNDYDDEKQAMLLETMIWCDSNISARPTLEKIAEEGKPLNFTLIFASDDDEVLWMSRWL